MADWKEYKDKGPWPFTPQGDKWGYLNNPRWLAAPRVFVPGGPDDYSGRESEEPQLWTSYVNPHYPSNNSPIHHQCGHWHKETVPTTMAPLEVSPYWQQSLDINGNLIAFAAVNPAKPFVVLEGDLQGDGSIVWEMKMSADTQQDDRVSPVRIIPNILDYFTQDEFPAPLLTVSMFESDHDVFNDYQLFPTDLTYGAYEEPTWEDFDIHTSGLGVCMTNNGPWKISVKPGLGDLWSLPMDIDFLLALLGPGEYEYYGQWSYSQGYSVQVDEYTGIFYILAVYADPTYTTYKFILIKSSNGINWSFVKEWVLYPTYEWDCMSLAVSNNHIYICVPEQGDFRPHVFASANGGLTWTDTVVGDAFCSTGSLAANGAIVTLYTPVYEATRTTLQYARIYRSTDSGVNWSQVLEIDLPLMPPYVAYPEFRTIRASGSKFVTAFCRICYPLNGASWVGTDAVVHDMSGLDQAYLCFWLSEDNGATWSLKVSPVPTVLPT